MSIGSRSTSFNQVDKTILCTPLPLEITPFKGHVISIEKDDWDKIPSSEKLFLSHLEEYFPKKEEPAFTAASRDIQYVATDILGAGKAVESIPGIAPTNPVLQAELTVVLGAGTPLLAGTAITTCMDAIREKHQQERNLARRKEDEGAVKINALEHVIGATELGMGVFATGLRPLALEASVQGVDTSLHAGSWLGQLSLAFNTILSFFSVFWFAGIAASSWVSLDDLRRLEKGLEEKEPSKVLDFLRREIDPQFSYTWELLKKRHQKEDPSISFQEWLKGALSVEVKKMAKDFLISINQEEQRSLDFDQMADKLLKSMVDRSKNGGDSILKEGVLRIDAGLGSQQIDFTPLEWIGLESIHRHRLEEGKKGFIRAFGEKLAMKVCDYIDQEKAATAELVQELKGAVAVQRRIAVAGVVFGAVGGSLVAAGYGAAIAAYFPLLTAVGIMTAAISVIGSYIDIHAVLKKMGMPEGKYEERINNIKIVIGIGMIVAIVVIASASTFGTVPGVIAFVALAAVVGVYVARRVKTHFQRIEEQKILCSAKDLIALRNKAKEILEEERKTEQMEKIAKLVNKKLQRTPIRVAPSLKKTLIEEIDIDIWEEKIKEWERIELETAKGLKAAFDMMAVDKETYTLWERFSEFFQGVPHLSRAFPAPTSSA